jgi:hypothetical protein
VPSVGGPGGVRLAVGKPSRRSGFNRRKSSDRRERGASVTATEQSLADRVVAFARTWWPVAAFLLPVLVVQAVWSARYDVAGHAADHLQSATPIFPMVFLSAVLLWALPGRGRRDPLLWLLLAAAVAGCLVVLVGNVRVVDAIGGATWNDTQASQFGPTRPGFASGHDLAELGAWGAVLATMLVADLLWLRRLVAAKVAVAAAAVSLVVPHFIAPGAGMVVLAVAAAVARSRDLRPAGSS